MSSDVTTPYLPPSIDRLIPRPPYNNASTSAIAAKVLEDIHFLQDRIDRVQKQQKPNTTVLNTYQSMLDSREAVLMWLRDNGDLEDEEVLSHLSGR